MKSQSAVEIVRAFFSELEQLSYQYKELTDTDVRETLHITLNYFFIWEKKHYKFPVNYCMFTREGNVAVAHIVESFLRAMNNCSSVASVPLGQARLDLLQNSDIKTPGGHLYDEFIGHVDKPLLLTPLSEGLFEEDYDQE
jgi:hypothetical protein